MSPLTHSVGVGGPAELRAAYRAGRSPVEVIGEVYDRIEASPDPAVWISLVPRDQALAAAAALPADRVEELALFGVPFAVKDNIDVAGMVTTAACPDFGYLAPSSAGLVRRLLDAGAILIGKTNLDQFATGLSGARSPYGTPANAFDPELIPGGSSSGSAVAVATGLVSFAIGTDTAGSGRVPAALNGIVGLKPSIGLVGTSGVLPACQSLDCASVFARSVADANTVLAVIAGFDPADPGARRLPVPRPEIGPVALAGLRVGVPEQVPRWGSRGEEAAWAAWCARVRDAGAELVPVDLAGFFEAGDQLYRGAWLAERLEGFEEFLASSAAVLPVTRGILEGGRAVTGTEVFAALTRMRARQRDARELLAGLDVLLTPTVTETFTVAEMNADPVELNARLGLFTTFTNLLDLCAVSVPVAGAVPFGVSVQATSGRDAFAIAVANALEALEAAGTAPLVVPATSAEEVLLAVVGAHLRGMPLHGDLVSRGAELVARTRTASAYRLFALAGGPPYRPGLQRATDGGAEIEVEVYRISPQGLGGLMTTVPAPLGIGRVELVDGTEVLGFICEPAGFEGAEEITRYGGWRAYTAMSDSR